MGGGKKMKEANFSVGEIVKLRLTGEIVMVVRVKAQYGGSGYDYSIRMNDLGIVEFCEEELETSSCDPCKGCPNPSETGVCICSFPHF
jgi:hypothetical protein